MILYICLRKAEGEKRYMKYLVEIKNYIINRGWWGEEELELDEEYEEEFETLEEAEEDLKNSIKYMAINGFWLEARINDKIYFNGVVE